MISGIFHSGSGLGNQLHRYIATRVLALDKGYDFSMVAPKNFKGESFMKLDMGIKADIPYQVVQDSGYVSPLLFDYDKDGNFDANTRRFKRWNEDTPYYNPEYNFIEDNTIIDGEFQDERYFGHRLKEIDEWLVKRIKKPNPWKTPVIVPIDICVIGFRGGEFYTVPELGLPKSYYEEGIAKMREINPNIIFQVHTDDEVLARRFFPDFRVIHDIKINWCSMRYAKYSIVANSSFYILPRLLKHHFYPDAVTIAPRYWDRYNIKKWERPYNYYKNFTYI